eukprot:scaffold7038_cov100-Skeletonema_marinoi.AAC.4
MLKKAARLPSCGMPDERCLLSESQPLAFIQGPSASSSSSAFSASSNPFLLLDTHHTSHILAKHYSQRSIRYEHKMWHGWGIHAKLVAPLAISSLSHRVKKMAL